MIGIIFPVLQFCISLVTAMLLIGYVDRKTVKPLRTLDIALLIAVPSILIMLAGLFIVTAGVPRSLQYLLMSFYLIFPYWLLAKKFRKSRSECLLYSFIILGSAFFSGAVVSAFSESIK